MVGLGKKGETADSAVLTDPIPGPNMVRMRVFRNPRRLRLLGSEEALLRLGSLVEALKRVFARWP